MTMKEHIPNFQCMLAAKMSSRFDWNSGPWLVEYKYDGMRVIARVIGDSVTYFSRTGVEQDAYRGLFDSTLLHMRNVVGSDIYVDGEVLAPTFQKTMQSRGRSADKSDLIFVAFDMLYADEWASKSTHRSQMLRRRTLSECLFEADKPVRLSVGRLCHTYAQLHELYNAVICGGAEGVIIKSPEAMYQWQRSFAWIKYKPFYDADLKIIGRYPGEVGSRLETVLGGLELHGFLEDSTYVHVNCGSGFSDKLRKELWDMDMEYLAGMTVEVQYQEVTRPQSGGTCSLRFPSFKKFREDK